MQSQLKQKEIAKFLSVSPGKIKQFTKDGMPHVFVGLTARYDCAEVLLWLKEGTQKTYTAHFIRDLERLQIKSCTCNTTSGVPSDHKVHCMYYRLQELINSL